MQCENCITIQKCKKNRNAICKDFQLFGSKPTRPKKSKDLCNNCHNDFYNMYKEKAPNGCFSYKSAKLVLQSYPNSLTERPPWHVKWQLKCFQREWR